MKVTVINENDYRIAIKAIILDPKYGVGIYKDALFVISPGESVTIDNDDSITQIVDLCKVEN